MNTITNKRTHASTRLDRIANAIGFVMMVSAISFGIFSFGFTAGQSECREVRSVRRAPVVAAAQCGSDLDCVETVGGDPVYVLDSAEQAKRRSRR